MILDKEIIRLYQQEEKSIREIAKIMDYGYKKISKILRKNNILLSNRRGNRFWMYKYGNKIVNLYVRENKTINEIADIIGCSLKPIRKILKENNVKIKTDVSYFKKGNNFGTLKKNIELRKNKNQIIRYYKKDMRTIREIANIFNCGTKVISNILKENNIKPDYNRKRDIKDEEIIKKYLNGNSTIEIAKEYNVTDTLIRKRLKKNGIKRRKLNHEEIGKKTSITKKRLFKEGILSSAIKGKTFEEYYGEERTKKIKKKIRKVRAKQIFPIKDTKIELKIQNFLKQLGTPFFPHQYMNIKHGYQCDIFIPSINLILETDGDYWHGNKEMFDDEKLTERIIKQRELDKIRTKELLEKGFKVLRLWEHDIKPMELNDFKNRLPIL